MTQDIDFSLPDFEQLSPSEGEEEEWLRLRGGLSQLDQIECSNSEKQESTKSQPPHADEYKATHTPKPATPPSTTGETTTTATTGTAPVMKRSSSGNRLQRKRPPRLSVSRNQLGKGTTETAEQDAGAFGDCLDFCKENLFRGVGEEVMVVPQEKILHRINSKMVLHSYQLGNQLSFRWTTGAGPRIGCVRDYPPELQFRSLEQVSLSPRGGTGPVRLGTPRQSPCGLTVPTPGVLGTPLYVTAAARCSVEH